MEGTSRVRAALTVEAAARLAGLPKIPASLVLSEELLKDPPRPVRAIKELQEPPHI